MNLEDACAAAWARARERCPACGFAFAKHTCYGDIEAVKAVALAALDSLDIDRQIPAVVAEAAALLGVKHD